ARGPLSDNPARLLESKPRIARDDLRRIAAAEVAEEVALPAPIREEGGIDLRVIETGHRAAIQAERARGNDHVRALQRAVAQRRPFGMRELLVAHEGLVGLR